MTGKTTNIIIRVTPEFKKELKKYALENDLTMTKLILNTLKKEVQQYENK